MTAVSVVVPTRGRPGALGRLLRSLAEDRSAGFAEDVVVVVDGDDDAASPDVARRLGARVVTQPWAGRAAARNRGAAAATGDVLLFLDDDVEALPGLVAAHLAARRSDAEAVTLGDYPVALAPDPTAAEREVWAWWEDAHRARRNADRLDATHVWSGNLAIGRELFDTVGGFDARFRRYGSEDVELGQRLLAAGARLRLVNGVLARHHARMSVQEFLDRAREEAVSHVRLAATHAELAAFTPLAGRPHGRVARLAERSPRRGAAASAILARAIPVADRARLRRTTTRLLRAVREERYWRAAREVSGGRDPYVAPLVVTIDVRGSVVDLPAMPRGVPVRVAFVDGDRLLAVLTVELDPTLPPRVAMARALGAHPMASYVLAGMATGGVGRNSSGSSRNEPMSGALHITEL